MRWQGRRESSNIEDRRGGNGGLGGGGMRVPIRAGRGGGMGLVGLLVVGAVMWFGFGINPMFLFGMDGGSQTQQTQTAANGPGVDKTSDTTDDFVATVLADTEDVWTKRFADAGQTYPKPTLVLFNNSIASACGNASSASGPF